MRQCLDLSEMATTNLASPECRCNGNNPAKSTLKETKRNSMSWFQCLIPLIFGSTSSRRISGS